MGEERRERQQRRRVVPAQQRPRLGEGEPAGFGLGAQAERCQGAQQPAQLFGGHTAGEGQSFGIGPTLADPVRQLQPRCRPDGLGGQGSEDR
ncbi:hypothetical protein GA0115253_105055 [Streptomyces sp. Termitarium-T10T-6]|nr:hypothetical protein GA0115253_105055 [Streptomyces sp. Termitarium-T10T-6]